jgi:type 1 glutamine amidotransferase
MKSRIYLMFIMGMMLNGFAISAQNLDTVDLTSEWISKIREIAPEESTVKPVKARKVLVFSHSTGFIHWITPHVDALLKVLSEKSGAFEMVQSTDINVFGDLSAYDAVVLNNNCSVEETWNLFWDEIGKNESLTESERGEQADRLEQNLTRYVKNGGGLMVIHSGLIMQQHSLEFSEMVGGSFDYHPVQQPVQVDVVDPGHTLVKAFDGQPLIHVDEPYIFNQAYFDYDFRPLLSMDASKLHSLREEIENTIIYVSWIRRYGRGRVFYVSPSHNAQSYEDPRLLQFYLDGLQYVTGDLKCDDTPLKQ